MAIKIVTSKGTTEVDEKAVSPKMLEKLLTPGVPVLLEEGFTKQTERKKMTLFFSAGHVYSDGEFQLQKGKRNFSIANLTREDNSYHLMNNDDGWHYRLRALTDEPFMYTKRITIGEPVIKDHQDAIAALKFSGDAVPFSLNRKYLQSNIFDRPTDKMTKRMTEHDFYTVLNACYGLIIEQQSMSSRPGFIMGNLRIALNKNNDPRHIAELQSLPLDLDDYLIMQKDPFRFVAAVKVIKTFMTHRAYILPLNGMDELIENAFSDEHVRKFYPYGLRKPISK